MFKLNRKRSIVGAAFLVLALAAGAYAYWTASGAGTGTATTGNVTALTVNQTTVLAPMYPGDSAQTISGTFDNTNSGPIHVGTVTAAITSVTPAASPPPGTCDATDFTLGNAAMTVDADVATGSANGAWTGATLKFNNKASNQDACKGATVNLSYTVS